MRKRELQSIKHKSAVTLHIFLINILFWGRLKQDGPVHNASFGLLAPW